MHICSPQKTGLIVGGLLAGYNAIWSILVATDLFRPIVDWKMSLFMINIPYTVEPFNIVNALILIAISAVGGYAIGYAISYFFSCCKGCYGGACCMDDECCYDGETAMEHAAHQMTVATVKKPAKKKSKTTKKTTKAKKKR